jgi:hypothetical protein
LGPEDPPVPEVPQVLEVKLAPKAQMAQQVLPVKQDGVRFLSSAGEEDNSSINYIIYK